MFPRLITTDFFTLHSYGVLLAVGILVAAALANKLASSEGLPTGRITDLIIAVVLSAILGAKLLMIALEPQQFLSSPRELVDALFLGGVFYGGLIAAAIAFLGFSRRFKLPAGQTADVLAPAVALGYGIGRWGCFMAGCCWGKECKKPWAVTFTDPYASERIGTPLDIALHPVQIYSSLVLILISGILILIHRKKKFHGQVFWTYIFLYSAGRFGLEFFRGDPRGSFFDGALSTSQTIGVLGVLVSLTALVIGFRRLRRP